MRCVYCNNEIPDGVRFCRICGAQIQEPLYQPIEQPQVSTPNYVQIPVKKTHKVAVLPICLTVALVISLCVIVFLLADRNEYKAKASRYDQVEELFDVDLEEVIDDYERYEREAAEARHSVASHNAAISDVVAEIEANS